MRSFIYSLGFADVDDEMGSIKNNKQISQYNNYTIYYFLSVNLP
jgi:hypothetical protein